MSEQKILAKRLEANRRHLSSIAYRMLGSQTEADDAVQETFVRVMRADEAAVDNFVGWLTTIVARVCLDMLRKRKSRREVFVDAEVVDDIAASDAVERERLLADSIGVAMLVVLETMAPPERVAFVLHDMFNLPFNEIAPIVGRSPTAARQLASRGRRRVQGAPAKPAADRKRRGEVARAFLVASQTGDFSTLLAILDPDIVLRADAAAVEASKFAGVPGLAREIHERESIANIFHNRLKAALPALVDGEPGLVFAPGGQLRMFIELMIERDRIKEISLVADPARVAACEITF